MGHDIWDKQVIHKQEKVLHVRWGHKQVLCLTHWGVCGSRMKFRQLIREKATLTRFPQYMWHQTPTNSLHSDSPSPGRGSSTSALCLHCAWNAGGSGQEKPRHCHPSKRLVRHRWLSCDTSPSSHEAPVLPADTEPCTNTHWLPCRKITHHRACLLLPRLSTFSNLSSLPVMEREMGHRGRCCSKKSNTTPSH